MWLLSGARIGSNLAPMGSFVRPGETASDVTAVQIMHKRWRQVVGTDNIGFTQ